MNHQFSAYGLQFQSELPLPELPPGAGNPDIFVRYRIVSELVQMGEHGEVTIDASPGYFKYTVSGQVSFIVTDGREVNIEALPESPEELVRAYFLGSIVGALLYQRHVLALHASCINTPQGAVLFAGHSGYGKSTLAAALMNRGYQMLSDDITVIKFDEADVPIAQPGIPSSRLWFDAIQKLDYPLAGGQRSRVSLEKHILPALSFCTEPQPVHAICFITPEQINAIEFEWINGADRIGYIVNGTYLPSYIAALGTCETHFDQAVTTAQRVKFGRIKRPTQLFLLDELVDCIESEILS